MVCSGGVVMSCHEDSQNDYSQREKGSYQPHSGTDERKDTQEDDDNSIQPVHGRLILTQ